VTVREKDCPECRWVTVVDAGGRRHLEMRWSLPVTVPAEEPVRRAA
jgi:hypothetical protein